MSKANSRQIVFPALDSEYRVESAGDANAGRGLTVHNLHCSEIARWPGDSIWKQPRVRALRIISNVDPSVGPDSALMFQILTKYTKPAIAPQAFAQMGFLVGKFATNALMNVKGAITANYGSAMQ